MSINNLRTMADMSAGTLVQANQFNSLPIYHLSVPIYPFMLTKFRKVIIIKNRSLRNFNSKRRFHEEISTRSLGCRCNIFNGFCGGKNGTTRI